MNTKAFTFPSYGKKVVITKWSIVQVGDVCCGSTKIHLCDGRELWVEAKKKDIIDWLNGEDK